MKIIKKKYQEKNKERYQNNKDEISKKHKEYNDLHKEDAKRKFLHIRCVNR